MLARFVACLEEEGGGLVDCAAELERCGVVDEAVREAEDGVRGRTSGPSLDR